MLLVTKPADGLMLTEHFKEGGTRQVQFAKVGCNELGFAGGNSSMAR